MTCILVVARAGATTRTGKPNTFMTTFQFFLIVITNLIISCCLVAILGVYISRKYKLEIALLKEQNDHLESKMIISKNASNEEMDRRERVHANNIKHLQDKCKRYERQIKDMKTEIELLRNMVNRLKEQLQGEPE